MRLFPIMNDPPSSFYESCSTADRIGRSEEVCHITIGDGQPLSNMARSACGFVTPKNGPSIPKVFRSGLLRSYDPTGSLVQGEFPHLVALPEGCFAWEGHNGFLCRIRIPYEVAVEMSCNQNIQIGIPSMSTNLKS